MIPGEPLDAMNSFPFDSDQDKRHSAIYAKNPREFIGFTQIEL